MKALIAALSFAVGGGLVGVGASIGLALAENNVGWSPDAPVTATHSYGENALTLSPGDTVKITQGIRAGNVFRYLGPTVTITANYTSGQVASALKKGERVSDASAVRNYYCSGAASSSPFATAIVFDAPVGVA